MGAAFSDDQAMVYPGSGEWGHLPWVPVERVHQAQNYSDAKQSVALWVFPGLSART